MERLARVEAADAFVFVTPEYNYGPTAALINAFSYLHHEWRYKPAAFVSYGGVSAGTRGVQIAKQVATTLKILTLPEAVSIPIVQSSWTPTAGFSRTTCCRAPPTPCSTSSSGSKQPSGR